MILSIDPNRRIEDNYTYAYMAVRELDRTAEGDAIVVRESESGRQWPASIVRIEPGRDDSNVRVILDVAWEKGKLPE